MGPESNFTVHSKKSSVYAAKSWKKEHFDSNPIRAFTFLEITMVIAIVAVLTGGAWLTLRGFLLGRSVEASAENLASLIRAAQVSSKETESAQMILLAREEAVWMRANEIIRRQEFKNDVYIETLELKGGSVEVPEEPIEDIGILIDENGQADSATIVLAKGKENAHVSVGGQIATSGGGVVGILESDVVISENVGIQQNEEALIVQTEPLSARGWQVININNVDKVKEVRLRVKLDSKLPASAHIHAYVFPGWYENKPVAHGVTGQQTMKSPFLPLPTYSLYRESTQDCLTFLDLAFTISGTLMKENAAGVANQRMELWNPEKQYPGEALVDNCRTEENGFYQLESIMNPNWSPYGVWPVTNPSEYIIQPTSRLYYAFTGSTLGNFLAYRNTSFVISGAVTGESPNNVMLYIDHKYNPNPIPDALADNLLQPITSPVITNNDGSYSVSLSADHYYILRPFKTGCAFVPSSITIFLENNIAQNFSSTKAQEQNPFTDNKLPLGDWSVSESQMQIAAIQTTVPVFSNEVKGYYVYKDKILPMQTIKHSYTGTQNLPMFYRTDWGDDGSIILSTSITSNNTLNPGGLSDFATENASLIIYGEPMNDANWANGYVYSFFAGQSFHTLNQTGKEAIPSEHTEWLVIPVNSLPAQTKFLRIALALYHQTQTGEEVFNLAPTISSTHPNNTNISSTQFDYQTDPFIIHYPWANHINDPFWLSHYAYELKPILRPYGVNVLARKGPVAGENYRDTGSSYKGFWYAPIYLDWDLILGNESLYWLIGWTTGAFELTNNRWRFTQLGDTYDDTTLAPPSHYLLKNFTYLSYWYLFQSSVYSSPSQLANLPKRFQEPLNLDKTTISFVSANALKLFERADPDSYSIPRESSSLSIPFLQTSVYPIWYPTLPTIFGQVKLSSAPDLYSSLFYLQEHINHTMLDIGIYTALTSPIGLNAGTVYVEILTNTIEVSGGGQGSTIRLQTLGNFETWSIGGEMSSWWQWYQNIPWAKGVAFPRKTGPLPTDISVRTGWEKPIITFPSNYQDYFSSVTSSQIYTYNPVDSYNATQVVQAPHTIFMSTSHYPLGIIQIAVKKNE